MLILILLVVALLFIFLERTFPATKLPKVTGWWNRLVLLNIFQASCVIVAGLTWDKWMQGGLFGLQLSKNLPSWAAASVAYCISTFVYYWWHRFRHESEFFWRVCHQLHHSPSRIEVLTSFYKHPLEILINSLISATLIYALLGCDAIAGAIYTALTALAEYFYHWNVRTPRWLGNFIQRPESHRVHHQRNRHTGNYADLPLWDWLFGTFINPHTNPKRCGFKPEQELEFSKMLTFQTVETPKLGPTCLGCKKRTACTLQRLTATKQPQ